MKIAKIMTPILSFLSLSMGGVKVVVRVQNLEDKKPALDQNLFVEKDRLRMDLQGAGKGEEHSILYRKDKDAVYMVNPAEKSYMEMTRADMKKAADKMKQAMEQMRAAMKNMPPQQREMMEKMMAGRGGMGMTDSAADFHMEYKKVGLAKVGSWSAVEYAGFRGGVKKTRVYVVEYGALGVAREDFGVMKELGEFFKSLHMGPQADFYRDSETLKGLPVRTVVLDEAGKDKLQMDLTEVKKESFPASEFDLPSGYVGKKMEIPDPGGHGPLH